MIVDTGLGLYVAKHLQMQGNPQLFEVVRMSCGRTSYELKSETWYLW